MISEAILISLASIGAIYFAVNMYSKYQLNKLRRDYAKTENRSQSDSGIGGEEQTLGGGNIELQTPGTINQPTFSEQGNNPNTTSDSGRVEDNKGSNKPIHRSRKFKRIE